MKETIGALTTACCIVALVLFTGCQPADSTAEEHTEEDTEHDHGHEHGHEHEHDHSDRPESLREAIVELRELSDSFCAAMDEDDTEAAHDPLHHLGELLEAMPELAADTDLSEEQWQQVKEEVDRLFDAFGEIDSTFHEKDGDKKAAYEDAKSTIEEGVAALETKLPQLGEDSDADHGHSHEEYEEVHQDE